MGGKVCVPVVIFLGRIAARIAPFAVRQRRHPLRSHRTDGAVAGRIQAIARRAGRAADQRLHGRSVDGQQASGCIQIGGSAVAVRSQHGCI